MPAPLRGFRKGAARTYHFRGPKCASTNAATTSKREQPPLTTSQGCGITPAALVSFSSRVIAALSHTIPPMPDIQAFRGLRYDLGHVGSLSDVIAPPYDVIGTDLQEQLYKKHPANVIRLILNREEPGDDESNNRYSRAARFLKNWRSEGVLFDRSRSGPVRLSSRVRRTAARRSCGTASWPAFGSSASARGTSIRTKKRCRVPSRTGCC